MKIAPAAVNTQARRAASVPEQQPHADQHGQQRNAERAGPVKIPVAADHHYVIGQEISSDARHPEPDQEVTDTAGRASHIVKTTVCHSRSIAEGAGW
jgi:hypothetical protein